MKKLIPLLLSLALFAISPLSLSSAAEVPPMSPGVMNPPVISSVAAGFEHTCVVRDTAVWCSGSNSRGQLGTGGTLRSIAFSPSLQTSVSSVAAGGNTTCAVKTDATLWCWGSLPTTLDPLSALPSVVFADILSPVQIPLLNVRSVAVGAQHICALQIDESVWCWGKNSWGQLGNNTQTDSVAPVRASIDKVQSLDVGTEHTCVVRTTHSVWCWGSNAYHRLGLRPSSPRLVPTYIPLVRAHTVATGDNFTCITALTERVQCWGRNQYGQLGRTAGSSRIAPHTTSVKKPVLLTTGDEFACAVTAAHTTWCWGRNRFSQLANGGTTAKSSPQKVVTPAGIGTIIAVGAGSSHACGITTITSAMWCWGLSLQGQLGDGGSNTRPRGTAIWPNGVTMNPIGSDTSARIVAAGDIACDEARRATYGFGSLAAQCGEATTAALATSLNPDGILVLGDTQYEGASIAEIRANYDVSWGPLALRTYPIRGNHEYITGGAAGYIEYFGAMSPSYWSTNAGGWRIIAVDSWCQGQLFAGCSATSVQTAWLTAELSRAHTENRCAMVIMHHPYVSSGKFATATAQYLWQASVNGGADLVITGHDHHYERFAPLDASGVPAAGGTPLIISGLGGAQGYAMSTTQPGSEFRSNSDHGVVLLTLTPTTFAWSFVSATDNAVSDSGSSTCTP